MANKIIGKYVIESEKVAEYTFAGNTRAGVVTDSTGGALNWSNISCGGDNTGDAVFLTKNKIHVTGCRIITPGAEGLRTTAEFAATFRPAIYRVDDGGTETLLKALDFVRIPKFNEWTAVDFEIEPYLYEKKEQNFVLGVSWSSFSVDDFNIISDYVGEKAAFYIEFEICTAGLVVDGVLQ